MNQRKAAIANVLWLCVLVVSITACGGSASINGRTSHNSSNPRCARGGATDRADPSAVEELRKLAKDLELDVDTVTDHGRIKEAEAREYIEFIRNSQELSRATAVAEPTSYDFEFLVLDDVQGLFGGQRVFLKSDGNCAVDIVRQAGAGDEASRGDNGFSTKRFSLTIKSTRVDEIKRSLGTAKFFSMVLASRWGVPDEAWPKIRVRLPDGRLRAVGMWAMDHHAGFTSIYRLLLQIVGEAELIGSGKKLPFGWEDVPAEFKLFPRILRD